LSTRNGKNVPEIALDKLTTNACYAHDFWQAVHDSRPNGVCSRIMAGQLVRQSKTILARIV